MINYPQVSYFMARYKPKNTINSFRRLHNDPTVYTYISIRQVNYARKRFLGHPRATGGAKQQNQDHLQHHAIPLFRRTGK